MIEIIAEIGQNFNGDMDCAKELIRLAKSNGADVAKFQVYDARALFPKEDNPWYDYNCKTELSLDNVKVLIDVCDKEGIEFMASVFDEERVDWMESLGMKRYKIASRSIHDEVLVNKVLETKKPVIVSLGMWDQKELPVYHGTSRVDFLYCISKYPTDFSDLKLEDVDFDKKYDGFSDHTIGIIAPVIAMSRGAKIIEKHFTMDKDMYGPDHRGSMCPQELRELVDFKNGILECL